MIVTLYDGCKTFSSVDRRKDTQSEGAP